MDKKIYAQPQLDVTRFETEDIIVTAPIKDEVPFDPDHDIPNVVN